MRESCTVATALVVLLLLTHSPVAAQQCTVEAYFSPYDNVEDVIVNGLVRARESVNCSLYGITNVRITAILKALVIHGTKVSLCLDKTQSAGKSSTHEALRQAGADVVVKKTGTLEHNKFCVIDNERVLMGSWNYSGNAQKQDNSMVVISGCEDVVKQFQDAFQRIHERDKD